MDKYSIRRDLLRKIIDERFKTIARFADAVNIPASYVSRMLSPAETPGHKRMGEDTVDKIELALGIRGYFSDFTTSTTFLADRDARLAAGGRAISAEVGMGWSDAARASFFDQSPAGYQTASPEVRSAVDRMLDQSPLNKKHCESLARMIHAYYETQEK